MSGKAPLHFEGEDIPFYVEQKRNAVDVLPQMLSGFGTLTQMWIASDSSLHSLCRRIVATWETDAVEPARQWEQKRRAILPKRNSSR
jgi:hypothetical protein